MEDAHAAVLDLHKPDTSSPAGKEGRLSFFGVYDGHGGEKVAAFSGENVHKILVKQSSFEAGDYGKALQDGFLATDRAILQGNRVPILLFVKSWLGFILGQDADESLDSLDPRYGEEVSGCTATTAIISETKIYVVSYLLSLLKRVRLLRNTIGECR